MTNNERAFQTQLQRSVELTLCGKNHFTQLFSSRKVSLFKDVTFTKLQILIHLCLFVKQVQACRAKVQSFN